MEKPYRLTSGFSQQGLEVDYRDLIKVQAQIQAELIGDVSAGGNTNITNIFTTSPGVSDFIKSGATHQHGLVPDPGVTAGTAKYLREDATWVTVPIVDADDVVSRYMKHGLLMPSTTVGTQVGYGWNGATNIFSTGIGAAQSLAWDSNDVLFHQCTTGVAAGNEAGYRAGSNTNYFRSIYSTSYHIMTGSTVANTRIWCVHYDAGGGEIGGGDDSGADEIIGWRYSTSVPETTWQCITGKAATGVMSVTDSGITVAADTVYKLFTKRTALGTAEFYINGTLVATKTNAPITGQGRLNMVIRTTTGASRSLLIGNIEIRSY